MNLNPNWELLNVKDEQESIAFLREVKKHCPKFTLEQLYDDSEESTFEKNFRITRCKEYAQYFYIVLRGFGEEST